MPMPPRWEYIVGNAPLFQYSDSISTNESRSPLRIECSALTEDDWLSIANLVAHAMVFSKAVGVPSSGLPFAEALNKFAHDSGPTLIVDDVLTTDGKLVRFRSELQLNRPYIGLVLFARRQPPIWVRSIFTSSLGSYL